MDTEKLLKDIRDRIDELIDKAKDAERTARQARRQASGLQKQK